MQPRSRSLLDRIAEIKWFSLAGTPPRVSSVSHVQTWSEALDCCTSNEWSDIQESAGNSLSRFLHENARKRFQAWNRKVDEIKPLVDRLSDRKLEDAMKGFGLETLARESCENSWDDIHLFVSA